MLSRTDLCKRFNTSLSTIRRILKTLNIEPAAVERNAKGLPVYKYTEEQALFIRTYLIKTLQKVRQKHCCICGAVIDGTYGNRCQQCYMKKTCTSLIFGKEPWARILDEGLVNCAVKYLKSFIQSPSSSQEQDASQSASHAFSQ